MVAPARRSPMLPRALVVYSSPSSSLTFCRLLNGQQEQPRPPFFVFFTSFGFFCDVRPRLVLPFPSPVSASSHLLLKNRVTFSLNVGGRSGVSISTELTLRAGMSCKIVRIPRQALSKKTRSLKMVSCGLCNQRLRA